MTDIVPVLVKICLRKKLSDAEEKQLDEFAAISPGHGELVHEVREPKPWWAPKEWWAMRPFLKRLPKPKKVPTKTMWKVVSAYVDKQQPQAS